MDGIYDYGRVDNSSLQNYSGYQQSSVNNETNPADNSYSQKTPSSFDSPGSHNSNKDGNGFDKLIEAIKSIASLVSSALTPLLGSISGAGSALSNLPGVGGSKIGNSA